MKGKKSRIQLLRKEFREGRSPNSPHKLQRPGVQNTTEEEVHNTTEEGVQNTTEEEVQNTTEEGVQRGKKSRIQLPGKEFRDLVSRNN